MEATVNFGSDSAAKAPWHLWVIGGISLLWNAVGVMSFSMTSLGNLESLGLPADQIAYYSSFPIWAMIVWAMGVFGCFLGSLALLFKSRHAVTLFGISILGLIATTIYQWGLSNAPADLKTGGNIALSAAIWIITISLFFYAQWMRRKGALK
ncbi:MAG: hypothetical protein AAGI28_10980 [Pseudomonadota bacterium]